MSEHGMIFKTDSNGKVKRIRARNKDQRPTPPKQAEQKTA